jgi:hypothetical protein
LANSTDDLSTIKVIPEAQAEAKAQARTALARFPNPDLDRIRACCEKARRFAEEDYGHGTVDVEELVTILRRELVSFVPPAQILSDARGHVDWLKARRGTISWRFLAALRDLPSDGRGTTRPVIRSIDIRTEGILDLLEDPERPGPWDRRGLVVGSVQSGKTGNFLGLACKALDAGSELVSSSQESTTAFVQQTQIRMEEGLLGYNTDSSLFFEQASMKIGVGTLAFPVLPVNSMTSRAEAGDSGNQPRHGDAPWRNTIHRRRQEARDYSREPAQVADVKERRRAP